MNEGYALAAGQSSNLIDRNHKLHSPTLAENIDNRIASMEDQIKRLTKVRGLLAEGRILDVPIEDLRFAMNY